MRVCVVGVKRQRMAVGTFFLVETALRAKRAAKANQIGWVRLERDCLPIMGFGAGVVAELADHAAEVDMRFGVTGAQQQRLLKAGNGSAVIALRGVCIARVKVRFRRLRVECQHVLITHQCFVIAVELAERRAEVQKRVDE